MIARPSENEKITSGKTDRIGLPSRTAFERPQAESSGHEQQRCNNDRRGQHPPTQFHGDKAIGEIDQQLENSDQAGPFQGYRMSGNVESGGGVGKKTDEKRKVVSKSSRE